MAEANSPYRGFAGAIVLLGFGWLAILVELAPLGPAIGAGPTPDLLFCVAAFLVLRRPNTTPLVLIAVLGLVRDLASGGAVGLGALALIGSTEILRAMFDNLRRRSFVYELTCVAVVAAVATALKVAVLTIALAPAPALDQLALRLGATFLAYLAVAAVFRFIFRVKVDAEDEMLLSGRTLR